MKTKIFFCLIPFLLMTSFLFAQSDYQTMQNFKKLHKEIEEIIKNASTLDECDLVEGKITNLKNDFLGDKAMLDKALYPENFESSLEKVENSLQFKKNDLRQITNLKTEVANLHIQLDDLNRKNEELLKQINTLKLKNEKDQATITKLNNLVAQLKGNINQRDLLVRDLVDTLLVQFIKTNPATNAGDAKVIKSKIKKENLFYNIERAITDNISFTKITRLNADDFSTIKKQYKDFNKTWTQIGPKLSSIYLNDKQRKSEIVQIDSLFNEWNQVINTQIWENIRKQFEEKNINLSPFNSSEQFVESTSAFIQDELKNRNLKSKTEAENVFHLFVDSLYFKSIEKKWIPLLIQNKMMTSENKNKIESQIELWHEELFSTNYLFIIIPIAFVIILIGITFYYKKNRAR